MKIDSDVITPRKNRVSMLWLIIHWLIIGNFLVEICYASYVIFVVIAPEGGGPLWGAAKTFPHEQMVTRRLYALECWIAIAGLAAYLAITEIGPRFWKRGPGE
jgi:hypothetical protein